MAAGWIQLCRRLFASSNRAELAGLDVAKPLGGFSQLNQGLHLRNEIPTKSAISQESGPFATQEKEVFKQRTRTRTHAPTSTPDASFWLLFWLSRISSSPSVRPSDGPRFLSLSLSFPRSLFLLCTRIKWLSFIACRRRRSHRQQQTPS